MYPIILVTLDTTPTDRAIIDHIKPLASLLGSQVVLLHVADGWAARRFGQDAVSDELVKDTAYLARVQEEFTQAGIAASTHLAYGEPAEEIIRWVQGNPCHLLAMSTHGHKGVADLVLGQTACRVQHEVTIPVLMLRAKTEN